VQLLPFFYFHPSGTQLPISTARLIMGKNFPAPFALLLRTGVGMRYTNRSSSLNRIPTVGVAAWVGACGVPLPVAGSSVGRPQFLACGWVAVPVEKMKKGEQGKIGRKKKTKASRWLLAQGPGAATYKPVSAALGKSLQRINHSEIPMLGVSFP
tara:strand:- start:11819 stop:12280 length:462 start_codon:yes stop_codon:yes gene_type:complete